MKNFKKILAIMITCAMLAAVPAALAGCGDDAADYKPNPDWETLIIGVTEYQPMNYKDEKGRWTGFETEFAYEVGKILKYNIEFLVIDWGSKEMEVNAGNIDAVWNGMTITPERAEEMDISLPYMSNGQVIVVLASNEDKYKNATDLSGVKVVAEAGSTLEQCVQSEAIFANVDYTGVDKQITGLMEVKSGTADMTVIDLVMAKELLKPGSDYSDLVYIDMGFIEEFGIALRKGSDDFEGAKLTLAKLNDAIKQLQNNGKLKEIAKKYDLDNSLT